MRSMDVELVIALAALRNFLEDEGAAQALRVENHLSLGDIARELGTSPTTVWRWERGERVPRGDLAVGYAWILAGLANLTVAQATT